MSLFWNSGALGIGALLGILAGCTADKSNPDSGGTDTGVNLDQDGDGFLNDEDCNDLDASVNPGVSESCDWVDNDCDGEIDEGVTTTYYGDADDDGFGATDVTTESCARPDGYVPNGNDCDDDDPDVYPGNAEVCDGLDNDCDGDIDEGATTGETATWYADDDGDGFGDPDGDIEACGTPRGYVQDATDCDDAEESVHPGADELCNDTDDDCDEEVDEDPVDPSTWYSDSDGDGYGNPDGATTACDAPAGAVADDTDCDDGVKSIHPGADETCNDLDDDCDGDIDESAVDAPFWYADDDGDGYGDGSSGVASCDAPAGAVADDSDCDDTDKSTYPGASEYCDGEDDDCDGDIDESAVDMTTWYADSDEDGYGDKLDKEKACSAPSGYTSDKTDCNDLDEDIHPGAPEHCDGVDEDCDGATDEGAVDFVTWYADDDDDGFGDATDSQESCSAPIGYVEDDDDCDDTDDSVYPGADEHCDGEDEDCDGSVDESAVDRTTYYADDDADGFGDSTTSSLSCSAPSGYVTDKTDCDDTDDEVYPGADEYCDGEDDDCDGSVDESAVDMTKYYQDSDSDGYGNKSKSKTACSAPSGYVTDKTDCDDTDSDVHPTADEYCNGVDDDCDGSTDESAVDMLTWYDDDDGDTYGDPATASTSCSAGAGEVADNTDCDDSKSGVHPGATEHCDGVDEDCDGAVDDSAVDRGTWYKDADGDDYGDASSTKTSCSEPSGYTADNTDCDDTKSSVNPGAEELCDDGVDQDCDGEDARCGPTGDVDLATAEAHIVGETDFDYAGYSVCEAGDVNQDGFDDVLVGAFGQDSPGSYAGAGYLVLGPISGTVDLSAADAKLKGEAAGDKAGSVVAAAGDVDGDGYPDLLFGAREEDSKASYAGAAYLMPGPISGTVSLSTSDAKITGTAANDNVGYSMRGLGDLDGDGKEDVVIGAHGYKNGSATSAGGAAVFYGALSGTTTLSSADAMVLGGTAYDFLGFAVAGAGDVDGDGTPDLLVGAYQQDTAASNAGAAYLLLGPLSGTLAAADSDGLWRGEASTDNAGYAVAAAGDLNGDGYDDVVIGAWKADTGGTDAGAAYVLLGPATSSASLSTASAKLTGVVASDYAGCAVAGGSDVDGDGYADLLIGAYREDTGASNAGAAYLVAGPVTGTFALSTADATLVGEGASDYVGYAVSTAGDTNGDGFGDLLVGAYQDDDGGYDAGAAYLVLGGAH